MDNHDLEKQLFQRVNETIKIVGKEYWFIIHPSIFAIPYLNIYILYSPLQGLAALITPAGLLSLLLNKSVSISECLSKCLFNHDLQTLKLFDTKQKEKPDLSKKLASEFKPCSLMLSLTSACQLACTYCYIRGGDNPRNMQWDIAKAAIQYTMKNASNEGLSYYLLSYHGQGEPTANWKLLKGTVSYTEKLGVLKNLKSNFSIVTNGILNYDKITFLINHNFSICLSMDGTKEIMDVQRPLRGGGSSFDRIMETIKSLDEKNAKYTIRCTVTELNMDEMLNFVDFIKKNTKCKQIFFEPVFRLGRAEDFKFDNSKIITQLLDNHLRVQERAIEQDIYVSFSACHVKGLRTSFCRAYGHNLTFAVSTDGLVSSCYEVLDELDPRSNIFIYGKYDRKLQDFQFDEQKLERLLNHNVTKNKRCENCFIKWNCGGGCLSKPALRGFNYVINDKQMIHCKLDHSIIKHELFYSIFQKK